MKLFHNSTRFLKQKRKSIYMKLVLSFLLMVVPILMLSLYLNHLSKNKIQDELSESFLSRIHFYLTSFETEVSRLNKMKTEFINDGDLLRLSGLLSSLDDFERTQTILRLQNKLAFMKDSSRYIERIKLFIPALERTLSETYGMRIPQETIDRYVQHQFEHDGKILAMHEMLILAQVYPALLKPGTAPQFVIEIDLDQAWIEATLRDVLGTSNGGGAMLIASGQEWWLSSGEQAAFIDRIQQEMRALPPSTGSSGLHEMRFEGQTYVISFVQSAELDLLMLVWQPQNSFLGELEQYYVWFWVLLVLSVLVVITFSFWIYRLIHKPLERLVRAFGRIEEGSLKVQLSLKSEDEFGYLYEQFNHMVGRLQQLVHEVYEQKINSQRSELKQLQAQINPHFLYNSLFMLKRMVVSGDTQKSVQVIQHIGDYFRYITRNSSDYVELAQEWQHLAAYAEIQSMRFARRITLRIEELPESLQKVSVPKLIVQPLLENVFQHGLHGKEAGGYAEIMAKHAQDFLIITVEDNGDELRDSDIEELANRLLRTEDQSLERTALLNIHRRLRLRYGPLSGLRVERSAYGGLLVELRIELNGGA